MSVHNDIDSSLCTEKELQIIAEVMKKTFLICVIAAFIVINYL